MHLRAGTDFVGVAVCGVIIANNKILLSRRGDKAKNESGKWEFPGGRVELDETFVTALIRELQEELAITVKVTTFLCSSEFIVPEKTHWVGNTYLCSIVQGTPKILEPEKCSHIKWLTLDDIKQLPLSRFTEHDFRELLKRFPHGL